MNAVVDDCLMNSEMLLIAGTLVIMQIGFAEDASAKGGGDVDVQPSKASNPTTMSAKEWKSDEYYKYIWTLPKPGYSGFGKISIESQFPKNHYAVMIGLDRGWLGTGGTWAAPSDKGAHEIGYISITLKPGETKVFDVSAGPHNLIISQDFYSSDELTVTVPAGTTQKFVCGENFSGPKKAWFGFYYVFHRTKSGKPYFYLRQVSD